MSYIITTICTGLGILFMLLSFSTLRVYQLIIGCLFLVIAFISIYHQYLDELKEHKSIVIIASTTENHLTSVIYITAKGDTVAQDYLTYQELCNLH